MALPVTFDWKWAFDGIGVAAVVALGSALWRRTRWGRTNPEPVADPVTGGGLVAAGASIGQVATISPVISVTTPPANTASTGRSQSANAHHIGQHELTFYVDVGGRLVQLDEMCERLRLLLPWPADPVTEQQRQQVKSGAAATLMAYTRLIDQWQSFCPDGVWTTLEDVRVKVRAEWTEQEVPCDPYAEYRRRNLKADDETRAALRVARDAVRSRIDYLRTL
jgi:hypothetical protein